MDIQNRKDISLLVTKFYEKLLKDVELNHFFEDIVQNNQLNHHLEIIIDFWEDILLKSNKYNRNAMLPHMSLNKTKPFKKEFFEIWLTHFNTTIDTYFEGEKTELAKTRALSIATIMQIKMHN